MRFFLKILKSKFLWHTGSPDHEINRLICDVIRQKFKNEKREHMHSYPFLRVASVVASNCNAPYLHLKAVSACKLDEICVESIYFFLVSKVTCSLIYVIVS